MSRSHDFGLALAISLAVAAVGAAAQPVDLDPLRHDRDSRRDELRALLRDAVQDGLARAAVAAGTGPACGAVVTEDLVLEQDLLCDPHGLALVVSEGVTVDLASHRIVGSVIECDGTHCTGSEGITLRNGTIEGRVFIGFCDRCVLDRIRVRGQDGFAVELGDRNLVVRSRFEDNSVAISNYFSSGRNWIVRSVFRGNHTGVVVGDTDGNVIWNNRFVDNRTGVLIWDEDLGFSSDNYVVGNVFLANDVGAVLDATNKAQRNTFAWNLFWANRGSGLVLEAWCTYFLTDLCGGAGSRVVGNAFFGNGFEPSERTLYDPDSGETSVLQLDDGISVSEATPGNAGLTLARNRALWNADLGIQAPGVSDGGGNRAFGNGDPRQCTGVDCGR